MAFNKESEFEEALIKVLVDSYKWEKDILKYKTEEELIKNWAKILFENNRQRDKLNDYPLTDSEMAQIIMQVNNLKTPLKLNKFINGGTVPITRDNQDDKEHLGKEIYLKIYDRAEIAAGSSRYQIAQQPKFKAKDSILPDRRGDFILLINGMPLIHVELKKSGIPVSQACNQIEKYTHENVFTGYFSLVQVFVAMNPEEMVYFANPGRDGIFNPDFYFHWANANNEKINDWKEIASTFLSIPMAHQLIGFYTVPDENDGILKVMRSYQYFAANKISDTVAKNKWENGKQKGGYIWHTTGSGKTMTAFKAAQLISNSGDADKVVFLLDRIELGTQSAIEYAGFKDDKETIQETEDTATLINKLKSPLPQDTLIVTSIQKLSNIDGDYNAIFKKADIDKILKKRIVFIVDECHRSSFGEMMQNIKHTFNNALFFGFSGTPIQMENTKKGNTTADVFGDELHRYSIAHGLEDKNVLGFDPCKVLTFKETEIREEIIKEQARVQDISEVFTDPAKEKIYNKFMYEVPMAGEKTADGKYKKGIEDYLLDNGQYKTEVHQKMVVKDIVDNFRVVSRNNKFHGIFATSSIKEACQYYDLLKDINGINVTALFDPNIKNDGKEAIKKEDALKDIISNYNKLYKQNFTIPTWAKMKKDIQLRLAHKKPYERITKEEQIDLLIVVDQMLTGYDSKWINVLYLDKLLDFENVIQAFSRTNRLFGPEKPFGCIRYYRAPYTMEKNINEALKVYSGDKPFGIFVIKLDKNIENMNAVYTEIKNIFELAGIKNFEKLPTIDAEKAKFAQLFNKLNGYLEAAKVQGFSWDKLKYQLVDEKTGEVKEAELIFDKTTYYILVLRYKELSTPVTTPGHSEDNPYDISGYITKIDTGKINADYMDSNFKKYKKVLVNGNPEELKKVEDELHKTFAALSQEEQKYANIILHDIQTGDLEVEDGKTLRDYINEYIEKAKNDQIHRLAVTFGLDENMLRNLMSLRLTKDNIDEFGRYTQLRNTVDVNLAKAYFEAIEKKTLIIPKVNIKVDNLLRDFILSGGYEIESKKINKEDLCYEERAEELIPEKIFTIPYYGEIAAGHTITMDEVPEYFIDINADDIKEKSELNRFYCLKVNGDSMINAGINDGDLILLKQIRHPHEGEKIACFMDGEDATLKTYHEKNGMIELRPENPNYNSYYLSYEDFENGQAGALGIFKKVLKWHREHEE